MEKLTLEQLAPYLPYKVITIIHHNTKPNYTDYETKGILIGYSWMGEWMHRNESTQNIETCRWGWIKPILHPLSDLTKEIEVNGEKFVPFKILHDSTGNSWEKPFIDSVENKYCTAKQWLKCIEWHFDVFGLIEKGLAIDINTL